MGDFSFPYPKVLKTRRPDGQGCLSCVHKLYCPAMYNFLRWGFDRVAIDDRVGVSCGSWSSNISDRGGRKPTQDDLDEEFYIYIQGTGSEHTRCGISDITSG